MSDIQNQVIKTQLKKEKKSQWSAHSSIPLLIRTQICPHFMAYLFCKKEGSCFCHCNFIVLAPILQGQHNYITVTESCFTVDLYAVADKSFWPLNKTNRRYEF